MIGIDFTDLGFDAVVEGWEAVVKRIAGFVDEVVARDPGVGFVAAGDSSPEMDHTVLKVFVVPERGMVGWVVSVPVATLAAGKGVQVENCVDVVLGTLWRSISIALFRYQAETNKINHPIEMLETAFLYDSGVHIVLKVSIVEWQSQAVQAFAGEKLRILLREEVLQEFVKEEFVLLLAQNFEHRCPVL